MASKGREERYRCFFLRLMRGSSSSLDPLETQANCWKVELLVKRFSYTKLSTSSHQNGLFEMVGNGSGRNTRVWVIECEVGFDIGLRALHEVAGWLLALVANKLSVPTTLFGHYAKMI